eukprot:gene188-4434_t
MTNWKNHIYKPVGIFGFFMCFVTFLLYFLTWFESFYPFRICWGYWVWIVVFNFFILTVPQMLVYLFIGVRYFFKKKLSETSNLNKVKTKADQRKYFMYVLYGLGVAFIISLTFFNFIFLIFTIYWSLGATYDPTINFTGGRLSVNGTTVYLEKESGTFAVRVSSLEDVDVAYGQGFAHAQQRYYQMDLNRKIAAGRASEILGINALQSDKFFRTLGLYHYSSNIFSKLDNDTKSALEAYTNGVNDFINKARAKPFELQIYNYPFQTWRVEDSIACLKLYQWSNSGNYLNELHRLRLLLDQNLTPQRVKEFFPPYPLNINESFHSFRATEFEEAQVTIDQNLKIENESFILEEENIIKEKIQNNETKTQIKYSSIEDLNSGWSPSPLGSGASKFKVNSIGGAFFGSLLTLDGFPIFAVNSNGPLTAPTEFMVMRLATGTREAFGSSLPGVPGILNGRNDKSSWNVIPSNADVQDLYIMNNTKVNDSQIYYHYKNQEMTYKTRKETITIKKTQTENEYVSITIRESIYGPIISDSILNSPKGVILSLKWSALKTDKTMNWMWNSWKSITFDSFKSLTQQNFESPASSIFFGNNHENIQEPLFIVGGTIPSRKKGHTGMFPRIGNGDYDWTGNIASYSHQRWPTQTHFVVGGSRFIERGFRNIYGYDFDNEYAAKRLYDFAAKKIESGTLLTNKQVQNMLVDTVDLMFDDFIPILNKLQNDTKKSILLAWDKDCRYNSISCYIWKAWYWQLTQLPSNIVDVSYWDNHRYLINTLKQENHADCLPLTCTQYAQQALDKVDSSISWKKFTPFTNIIMKDTAFNCFGTRYFESGGSFSTLNQFPESNPSYFFQTYFGPNYRHVMDLELSKDSVHWQYPLSNSGWQYQRYGEYDANFQNYQSNVFFSFSTVNGKFASFSPLTSQTIKK